MIRLVGPPAPPNRFGTLIEALQAAASSGHGYTFVDAREEERFVSYDEVYAGARKVAAALMERGVTPGDRVAIVLPTCPGFAEAFFGVLCAGAIPVPLYPPVRLGRMEEYHRATARMLRASGARMVVTDARIRLLLGKAVAEARPDLGVHTTGALRETSPGEVVRPVTLQGLALVQFSSGSTVDPKPVALSHANLLAMCVAMTALVPELPGTRHLGVSWLPLYHDMGLIGALLIGVHHPGPYVLLPPEAFLVRPALWLRAISRHRATVSPAPNFAYGLCLKRVHDEDLVGVDLSSWKYAMNGAEPVSPEVLARFVERFARYGFEAASMMPVYGLSEASLAVTFSPRRSPARTVSVDPGQLARDGQVVPGQRGIVSVGTPIPGVEVEVRDELGLPVGPGRVGRIHVRGPAVMVGYLERPEATAEVLSDGWLDTGDLGFIHEGELHICGRAKDLVIIRGANHAPQEFEECVDGIEGVRTGCVVALGFVPGDSGSEELLLLVERAGGERAGPDPGPGDAELEGRIRAAVVERTGIRPHTVRLLEPGTLPRTSSGKLRRREALRRFLAGELIPPGKANAVTVTREMVKSTAAWVLARLTAP